jgi:putative ATP-dependent endonuclease of OLD family
MKLSYLRISNFRSFGETPTSISLRKLTFLLGPNGSGKTAVLQALVRMFGFDRTMRRIHKADFHVPDGFDAANADSYPLKLWIEAQFRFPELKADAKKLYTIPSNFAHMRLKDNDDLPIVRFRLAATLDADGDIEEKLTYVLEADADGEPTKSAEVPKLDRSSIQVHYLPARRDPTDHISYAATSLLGRLFRAADWSGEQKEIATLSEKITSVLKENEAVTGINSMLSSVWAKLHKGSYYSQPALSFGKNDIDSLLKYLTLTFSPGHGETDVDFSRLGDGQKSMLYLSLVFSIQELGRQILAGKVTGWDVGKLQPPIFSLLAVEEPENSLSPHHLGRVVKCLSDFSGHIGGQALVATHSPSLLKRVEPEAIRYLRLNEERHSVVKRIALPPKESEAHKYVREAVQAYPELYFSKLVILGEGDSEEIVIPKLFLACGHDSDTVGISVVPLGGRHVNHFWRLLNDLGIPHATLLDLDLGRYQGGWGRVRYAADQLLEHSESALPYKKKEVDALPKWNGGDAVLVSTLGQQWLATLEKHGVFFSTPLDLDFAMLQTFTASYAVGNGPQEEVSKELITAVLGKKHHGEGQYTEGQQQLFGAYHKQFKLGSKPVAHLTALSALDEATLKSNTPASIERLLTFVEKQLKDLHE